MDVSKYLSCFLITVGNFLIIKSIFFKSKNILPSIDSFYILNVEVFGNTLSISFYRSFFSLLLIIIGVVIFLFSKEKSIEMDIEHNKNNINHQEDE